MYLTGDSICVVGDVRMSFDTMGLTAVKDALSAAPHQVRDIINTEFDRLASHGIRLPYTDDQLPLLPAILPARWRDIMGHGAAIFTGLEHLFSEK